MNRSIVLSVFVILMCFWAAKNAWSQPGEKMPSLGELARQVRAERAKAADGPSKVFTNDNLPAKVGLSESPLQPAAPPASAETPSSTTKPEGEKRDEKYYREKLAEIRGRLDVHRRQLTVLEQKLAQNQMQYYPDPNETLQQEFDRSDINKLNEDIAKKKSEIAADEQAIEDLRDQLRRDGGPPGWLQ